MKKKDLFATRRLEEVEVYRGQGDHVVIKQYNYGGEDAAILLHPSQVATVVKWMREVAAQIRSHPQQSVGVYPQKKPKLEQPS